MDVEIQGTVLSLENLGFQKCGLRLRIKWFQDMIARTVLVLYLNFILGIVQSNIESSFSPEISDPSIEACPYNSTVSQEANPSCLQINRQKKKKKGRTVIDRVSHKSKSKPKCSR